MLHNCEKVLFPGNWTESNKAVSVSSHAAGWELCISGLQGMIREQRRKNTHLDRFPFWNYLCVPIGMLEMSLEKLECVIRMN